MAYRIAICDDNETDTQHLQKLVNTWAEVQKIPLQIERFPSAESFLFHYAEDKTFDLLLLDIEMGAMDGVTLARRIRTDNESVQIIFITGYPDYMDQGYEVSALHYLMKPVNQEKLHATLDRAFRSLTREKKAIFLPLEGESVRILVDDIQYIEAFDHRIDIFTETDSYSTKLPLREMEAQLTEDFVRLHRSCIANLQYIKKITKTEVILDSGKTLPVSRRSYADVNHAMMKYVTGGSRP